MHAPVIRRASAADAVAVASLLTELGYPATQAEAERRLATTPDLVLLAEIGSGTAGLLALHIAPALHIAHPVARITTFVVAERARGTGIGTLLLEHAVQHAREAGCGAIELTSGTARHDAHEFYRSRGFAAKSLGLHREL